MRILYAEDSLAIAQHVGSILKANGHQVTHVQNGREAVQAYRASTPDLVLMDVVMPEMDGIEATRHIKALGSERWVPLIIMTGLSSQDEILAGLAAGADDYLVKPMSVEVLEARMRAMQRIAQIQDSLHGILDNVFEGIVTINGRGLVVAFNKAAEQIFGYGAAEIIGQNVNRLMPSPYQQEHDHYLARYLAGGEPRVIGKGRKVTGLRKNGETFPMRLAVTEVEGQKGRLFIGLVRDIAEEEAVRKRIEHLASHDALTNLPNRLRLEELLEQMLTTDRQGYLLFIDLDGFKPINDQLGHKAGDLALQEVARRLKDCLGPQDFVGRLGGDEFVAILDDLSEPCTALTRASRMIEAISAPMALHPPGTTCQLGASIGIAPIGRLQGSATDILTAADNAMYRAKSQGKGKALLAPVD